MLYVTGSSWRYITFWARVEKIHLIGFVSKRAEVYPWLDLELQTRPRRRDISLFLWTFVETYFGLKEFVNDYNEEKGAALNRHSQIIIIFSLIIQFCCNSKTSLKDSRAKSFPNGRKFERRLIQYRLNPIFTPYFRSKNRWIILIKSVSRFTERK